MYVNSTVKDSSSTCAGFPQPPNPPSPAVAKAQSVVPDILYNIPATAGVSLEQPSVWMGVGATGGMEDDLHSGSIIATLQALKNLPSFQVALHKVLTLQPKESNEKLHLRRDIQRRILDILTLSSEGKMVSSEKVTGLRLALFQYNPIVIDDEISICEVWNRFHRVFELTPLKRTLGRRMRHIPAYNIRYNETTLKSWYYEKLIQERFGNAPEILPVAIFENGIGVSNHTHEVEPVDEIVLNCDGVEELYQLRSCAALVDDDHFFYHLAFLKDEKADQWVQFHKARVQLLGDLKEADKRKISVLYYQKAFKTRLS